MTPFEIIILTLIYCFCFGYANSILTIDTGSRWEIVIHIVGSVILAFFIPIIIGVQIANKLND